MESVGSGRTEETWTPEGQLERDQISVLFGRWVFAPHGLEIYGEWARFEQPASFRDFLEFPQHSVWIYRRLPMGPSIQPKMRV